MSSPPSYPPQNNASFPALHLYPLDDSFIPKRIALGAGQRVKIARPPNTKTQPGERNGYFDSRVLSRQHAEVWEEGNKIFIKDVKSSNGTFINGERLSLEGRESEPYELKSDDILEFGVDIVSEDNKTVLHRKVVARVTCVFPTRGATMGPGQGAPPLPHDQFATLAQSQTAAFNGLAAQRRPQMPMIHQGLTGLGGMGGGGPRAPGRGLTLDHIFSRLQAELAKSRDTGHDLHVLTGALNNIEDTMNGALPPSAGPPSFPDVLPGVRPRPVTVPSLPPVPLPAVEAPAEPPVADAVAELQAQLREHQAALASHVEGIRALEGALEEQDALKREVRELREFVGVDRAKRGEGEQQEEEEGEEEEEEELEGEDDDSDAQSVMTVTPHELDRVEEEEEEGLEDDGQIEEERRDGAPLSQEQQDADDARQEREDNLTRQRAQTPEPSFDMGEPSPPAPAPAEEDGALSLGELTARLALLTTHLEAALAASSTLQAQHAAAQTTIAALEAKLARLEDAPPPPPPPAPAPAPVPAASSAELADVQAQLAAMRAELAAERGQREAWAGAVEARILLANAHAQGNGRVEGKHEHEHEHEPWGRASSHGSAAHTPAGSVDPSPGSSPSPETTELGLGPAQDVKPPLILAALDSEDFKSLRADPQTQMTQLNVQAALGVLILGIAAAAVLWRVKPE